MENISNVSDGWIVKSILGVLLATFAPFKISLIVLALMLIINASSRLIYGVKIKKVNEAGFNKSFQKIVVYCIIVGVVRMVEIGTSNIFKTQMLTNCAIGYLVVTEAINIMKNLILLDVPVNVAFIKKILEGYKGKLIKSSDIDDETQIKPPLSDEFVIQIDDMMSIQLKSIEDESIKSMLKVMLVEWRQTIKVMGSRVFKNSKNNGDIIILRINALTDETILSIKEKWYDIGIPKSCIDAFKAWNKENMDNWNEDMNNIAKSSDSEHVKERRIMVRTMMMLYKTIMDIAKDMDHAQCHNAK